MQQGILNSAQGPVDSEQDVIGSMTQVDTMHGRKAAADVQPKAPSQLVTSGQRGRQSKGGYSTCTVPAPQRQDA